MKVIFSFAHPDDESVTSGGTIAKLTNAGITVKLICATKGEVGQLGNPPIATQPTLGGVRAQELQEAAKILGIEEIFFLGFVDGGLAGLPNNILTEPIMSILQKEQPDILVTFNQEGTSHHPDHIKMGEVTTQVYKAYKKIAKKPLKLYYTATPRTLIKKLHEKGMNHNPFGKVYGTPNNQITTLVDVHDTLATKIKALQCHKTQQNDVERLLKRKELDEFYYEYFKLVDEGSLI